MRIEMRRTVEIREFLRVKRMWNDMIDSTDDQMICNPLHHLQSFVPSVSSEGFTHGITVLERV